MIHQTDRELLAWAAGLFEGEGHIKHRRYNRSSRPGETAMQRGLTLTMADEDVVRRFHEIVGVGSVNFSKRARPHWSDQWRWDCTSWPDVRTLLHQFLPYLGKRRTLKAQELLADPARTYTKRKVTTRER